MGVRCQDVFLGMEKLANPELQEKWDNSGFLVGEYNVCIDKILVALDCIDKVIDEAINMGANMIVTHHPIIFKSENTITDTTPLGRKIIKLIKNNISVYSAHTNLDIAFGGTNDTLFHLLGLYEKHNLKNIEGIEAFGMGRVGNLKNKMTLIEFAKFVKEKIKAEYVTYTGDKNKLIQRVGICTGSGANMEYMKLAKDADCDVYITGDIGYHAGQAAIDMDLCLIDATHYYSEVIVGNVIADYLKKEFPNLEIAISKVNGQTLNMIV